MNRFGGRALLVAGLMAGMAIPACVGSVDAECAFMDPWPSFREAARTAKRIVVGEVVESYFDDSAENAIMFRFRVDEVLRGRSDPILEFRDVVRSGAPLVLCPPDSILRVQVGDVLALAFDARVSGSPDPVLAVAWIRGTPHEFLMPGAERLSLAEVHSLAATPATDTAPKPQFPDRVMPIALLLAATLITPFALFHRMKSKTD